MQQSGGLLYTLQSPFQMIPHFYKTWDTIPLIQVSPRSVPRDLKSDSNKSI